MGREGLPGVGTPWVGQRAADAWECGGCRAGCSALCLLGESQDTLVPGSGGDGGWGVGLGMGGGGAGAHSRGTAGLSEEGVAERRGSAKSSSSRGCGSRGRPGWRWRLPFRLESRPVAGRLGPQGEGSQGSSLFSSTWFPSQGTDPGLSHPSVGSGPAQQAGRDQGPGGGQAALEAGLMEAAGGRRVFMLRLLLLTK